MANSKSGSFSEQIASELQKSFKEEWKNGQLPSISSLANHYNTSRYTIRKSLAILEKKGVIQVFRGKKTGPKVSGKPPVTSNSLQRIIQEFKSQIEEGRLRAGTQLLKLNLYAEKFSVSNSTLIKALRALEKERLIHKKGKFWVIGPAGPALKGVKKNTTSTGSPVILLIHRTSSGWRALNSNRTNSFVSALHAESKRYGVDLIHCITKPMENKLPVRYSGYQAIRDLIKHLGIKYQGAIITDNQIDASDELKKILPFNPFKRRLVWLDIKDSSEKTWEPAPLLFRCHFSEMNAIRFAVKLISEAGFEKVFYPYDLNNSWQVHRLHLIQQEIKAHPPKLGFFPEPDFKVERLKKITGKKCVLTPNDYRAIFVSQELENEGLLGPGKVSLLGFDNYTTAALNSISSIDFGFDYLGYAGFHLLFGAIPIHFNSKNEVPTRPFLVERGTFDPFR